jgi:type IV pilus assembly protein PilM
MNTLMLHWRRKNVVGLDIGTSAVRMVQLRRDAAGYIVVRAVVADIAPWGDDPSVRDLHVIQAIRQGLADSGIRVRDVVCGLCGPEIVVRGFEFPPLTPEEITGAVELEVSQICPLAAEESTLDYQVTSNDEKATLGFWVAATHGLIENTRQLVSRAGLHCALVDGVGLALLNLLALQRRGPKVEEAEAATLSSSPSSLSQDAVLNLGDSCDTMAVADSAGRPFVRDIGGSVLAQDRQVALAGRGSTHGEGSPMPRFSPGRPSFSAEDGWAARSDYRSATNDSLVEDIATTLRYYAVQNGSTRVERLLVCGGADLTEDFLEMLRLRLNIDVARWNPLTDPSFRMANGKPWDAGDTEPSAGVCDPQQYGPSLAVAAGLALRHI